MSEVALRQNLEALLFVASRPLGIDEFIRLTGAAREDIEYELSHLKSDLSHSGLRLSVLTDEYRLVTAPEVSDTVRNYLQANSPGELTKPALETLAIVAYRGPLTKTDIEGIRGVASETMLKNLLARGLIVRAGTQADAARATLYAISHSFLQQFGLTSPADLPPLPDEANEA